MILKRGSVPLPSYAVALVVMTTCLSMVVLKDVSVNGDLTLDVDARIDGNIDAKQIEINGTVKNITASVSSRSKGC